MAEQEKLRKEKIQKQYREYLDKRERNLIDDPSNIADDTKVRLMRELLSVQLGEEFINSSDSNTDTSFPAFYALDLIEFGIKKDMPGAIRLGEMLLAENCAEDPEAKIPSELSAAVRNYLFENQDRYRSAIKQTGPLNSTALYHKRHQDGDEPLPMIFCADDPYYQDLLNKNYKRED